MTPRARLRRVLDGVQRAAEVAIYCVGRVLFVALLLVSGIVVAHLIAIVVHDVLGELCRCDDDQ